MGAFESCPGLSFYPLQDPAGAQGLCSPFPGRKAGASSQVLVVLPQGQLLMEQSAWSLPIETIKFFPAQGKQDKHSEADPRSVMDQIQGVQLLTCLAMAQV